MEKNILVSMSWKFWFQTFLQINIADLGNGEATKMSRTKMSNILKCRVLKCRVYQNVEAQVTLGNGWWRTVLPPKCYYVRKCRSVYYNIDIDWKHCCSNGAKLFNWSETYIESWIDFRCIMKRTLFKKTFPQLWQ